MASDGKHEGEIQREVIDCDPSVLHPCTTLSVEQELSGPTLQYCSMATECMECGLEENHDAGIGVGTVTGDYGPICNDCWGTFLQQETVLSERESEVAALKEMGYSHQEAADILGLQKSTVDTYAVRIMSKIIRAQQTVDELGHMNPEVNDDDE